MKLFVFLAPVLALVVGCALEPKQSGEAQTTSVAISGSAFKPGTAHLTKGQKVTFTNQDAATHSVRWTSLPSGGAGTDSSNLGQGGTFDYTPTVAGQYDYRCGIHASMTGTLMVAEAGAP